MVLASQELIGCGAVVGAAELLEAEDGESIGRRSGLHFISCCRAWCSGPLAYLLLPQILWCELGYFGIARPENIMQELCALPRKPEVLCFVMLFIPLAG